jgi:deazaflavin-dependent oxidoreductase (nitroreductase family)
MDVERLAIDNTREGSGVHARQYMDLGWDGVDHPFKERLLLLYTKGRISGQYRRIPLVYHMPEGDSVVIAANNAGSENHPQWYHNLVADPTVWVRNREDFYEATAEVLDGEEHAQVWSRLAAAVPFLAQSQAKVERTIPLIRVTRSATSS